MIKKRWLNKHNIFSNRTEWIKNQDIEEESPAKAVIREMKEETGIKKNYKIIYECKTWYFYKLPSYLRKKLWKGRFIGQKQKWFIISFTGKDEDINIKTKKPEFKKWEWSTQDKILKKIVPFKRRLYTGIFKEINNIDS